MTLHTQQSATINGIPKHLASNKVNIGANGSSRTFVDELVELLEPRQCADRIKFMKFEIMRRSPLEGDSSSSFCPVSFEWKALGAWAGE
ncbi:hypothetical protein [Bradyrhizobium sp. USDA 223]|uniref:hypothetical protein n=1 Tax=Bradyrhizobium sp. USDA 223 TaxID=3156306 RepID=UPI0038373FBD